MSRVRYFNALWLLGGLLTGCGEDLTAPDRGAIEVTSVTAGDPIDPDGYTLAVDGVEGRALGTNSTLTVSDLSVGDHELELGGIAPNCVLTGPNPRIVAVSSAATARTTFEVSCNAPTGSIELTTATTGESPDPDGYSAALDGGPAQPIGSNGTITFAGVIAGDHTVSLTGLAPNCTVGGENPRTVAVGADAAETRFEITCVPPVGTIQITATTIGRNQDPDGYTARLDGGPPAALPTSGSIEFTNVPIGEHIVELSGLAGNCKLSQPSRTTVTVSNGGTVRVAYDLSCVGTGRILFTSDRTGSNHVYVMSEDGSGITDLTSGAGGEQAAWSPDRSRIAFGRGELLEIHVMRADGSRAVRITQGGGANPAWSPDGRQIAFSNGSISIMNADGTGLRTLAAGRHPSWSPDGTRLAFDRVDRTQCNIIFCPVSVYTIAVDGTQERRVTGGGTNDQSELPAWSPDGQKIGLRQGGFPLTPARIVFLSPTGTVLGSVSPGTLEYSAPTWSPDGTAVAVGADSRIQVVPVAGGPAVTLLGGPGTKVPTSWR